MDSSDLPPTPTSSPSESSPRLFPLPSFAQPPKRTLDELPDGSTVTPSDDLSDDLNEPESPSSGAPRSPRTNTSTSRKPGGDPNQVAQVLGGLLVLLTGTLGLLAARRNRGLRQPTPKQRDAIAEPLAAIAVRHLPLDMIGPDLADATAAAIAVHGYVMDGPLIVKPTLLEPDQEGAA